MKLLELLDQQPLLVIVGCIALAGGLILGLLLEGAFGRSRRLALQRRLEDQERDIKTQEALSNERERALELAQERLGNVFGQLAKDQLSHNTETFLRLAQERLAGQQQRADHQLAVRQQAVEAMVKPIGDALAATERQVKAMEHARQEAYGGIKAQLAAMAEGQDALKTETRQLVTALRRPEVRGQWGEITLRRLVELAGMVEHCDFVEQSAEAGNSLRPDLVVQMPDDRQLIVDVKTPLDAYLDATEASREDQKSHLARHASNVAQRIRELASKRYWAQFERSPDFVILFIPGDQFLAAALSERPGLLDDALRQQVILATPTSLVALLKAVAYGWQQQQVSENAQEIKQRGVELYERLTVFSTHLEKLGERLGGSVDAYNRAIGSLERNVLSSARRFTALGVNPKEEMGELEMVDHDLRTLTLNPKDKPRTPDLLAEPSETDPPNPDEPQPRA